MERREAGWREVLIVAAIVVAIVLALQVLSMLVPQLGDLEGRFPLVIVVLIVVTLAVLWLALRPRREP